MDFLKRPSTDFAAVRDGRASMPLWIDIDLSTARSISGTGANAAMVVNIAGNSFYVDQDTANVGNAIVHFQDTNLGNASAPLFVSAGFIANVPFTQILVENAAQAGKRLRIFYGVDIDFQAGINASISISGTVAVSQVTKTIAPDAKIWTQSYKSNTSLAANTPDTIVAPGTNVNGVEIIRATYHCATGGGWAVFIAKAGVAPTSVVDGDVLEAIYGQYAKIETPLFVPAGRGIYAINGAAEGVVLRSMLYRLL